MRVLLGAALLAAVAVAGCIVRVREVEMQSHRMPLGPVVITTPVKAHLNDGSTILYANGVEVTATELVGTGARFDLALRAQGTAARLPLDSVGALESFREGTNEAASVALSLLGTAGGTLATALALVAIFGSCPTIYADSADTTRLQAELFSYSIAPLFEMRDVDAVHGRADAERVVWLELRNEALETHYINHLELLQVRHASHERLLPDEHGRPVLIGPTQPPRSATDAEGRDVLRLVARTDSRWYATANKRVTGAHAVDYSDHIELHFALAEARDSVALVLSLRNSLLNTVLFYDIMLGAAGARAIDWLGGTLEEIGEAARLARWYSGRTGIRVSVWRDGAYQSVTRIPDVGPIAVKDLALVLPTGSGRDVRVRLEFLADSWRIDGIGLTPDVRRGRERILPVTHVAHARLRHDSASVERLREPDDRYFVTYPGTTVRVGFDAGTKPTSADSVVGYLIAGQGYYTEWIRTEWVKRATAPVLFVPGDDAIERTFARWLNVRGEFERRFYAQRVPVRLP